MAVNMRMTQVASIIDLSPHMRRIVLTGDDLKSFPVGQESAHVKVIIPRPGQIKPRLGMYLGAKKWMRSYTIRHFDQKNYLLSIDFAVNDHVGLASTWALKAKPGDYLGIAGPGAIKHTNMHASWHLILGDLTALPAIAATIEKLPENARGFACIQVPSKHDIQDFRCPESIHLKWIVNQDQTKNCILNYVKTLSLPQEDAAIFIAAEGKQMKILKAHIKTLAGYLKKQTYASAYWNQLQTGQ